MREGAVGCSCSAGEGGLPVGGRHRSGGATTALQQGAKSYDAFISYSHSADGRFAPALQRALQRFAKPWRSRRALEVFRDETGLAVNPDLWASICAALDVSGWFVLLCSPDAARSEWVGKEVERWVAARGSDRLLLVVTDGSLVWDDRAGDYDPERSTALHPALRGVFRSEPRHIEMQWARSETDLTIRHPRFRDQIAEIAAPMHGLTKDDLEGEDVRQQRRTRRAARGAVSMLALLTLVAVVAGALAGVNAAEAREQRQEAIAERDRATSQALASRSIGYRGNRLDERILLAAEAWGVDDTPAAQAALLAATSAARFTRGYRYDLGSTVVDGAVSADGSRVATIDGSGFVRVDEVLGDDVVTGSESVTPVLGTDLDVAFVDARPSRLVVAGPKGYLVLDPDTLEVLDRHTGMELSAPVVDARGFVVSADAGGTTVVAVGDEEPRRVGAVGQLSRTPSGSVRVVGWPTTTQGPRATVDLVDPIDGAAIGTIDVLAGPPFTDRATPLAAADLAPADDPDRLAVLDGPTAYLYDGGERSAASTPDAETEFVAALHLGAIVVLGTTDGSVLIHDVETGLTTDAGGLDGDISTLRADAAGSTVLVAGRDGAVEVLDPSGTQIGRALGADGPLADCSGRCLDLGDDDAVVVTEGAVEAGPIEGEGWMSVEGDAIAAAISNDGSRIAINQRDGTVTVTDGEFGGGLEWAVPTSATEPPRRLVSPAFAPDGSLLAGGASLLALDDGATVEPGAFGMVDLNQWSGDGTILLTTATRFTASGTLTPYDRSGIGLASDEVYLRDFASNIEPERCNDRAPEDEGSPQDMLRRCGIGGGIGPIPPGDYFDGAVWTRVQIPAGRWIQSATLSTGDQLLLGADGGVVLRYQLVRPEDGVIRPEAEGEVIPTGRGAIAGIVALAEGRFLALRTTSGLSLHDVALQTDLGSLGTVTEPGLDASLAGSPDGRRLAFGIEGRGPRVLDLDADRLLDALCPKAGRRLTDEDRQALEIPEGVEAACPGQPEISSRTVASSSEVPEPDPDGRPTTTTTTGEASGDEGTVEPQTLESFLVELLKTDRAGDCDELIAGQVDLSAEALCTSVLDEVEDRAIVTFGYFQGEALVAFLLERDGRGTWQIADRHDYPFNDEPEVAPPDWLEAVTDGN
ncbi:MAG: toll/interleukin-1 receptor domain-containing protein [Acidimicrobiales bacterium]